MALVLDKSTKYRFLAVGLIDDVMIALEKEKSDKGSNGGLLNENRSTCEGELFEISHTIDIEQERKRFKSGKCISSKAIHIGDYEFDIDIYPNGIVTYKDKDANPVGIYLNLKKRPPSVKSTTVSWTFSAYSENGTKIAYRVSNSIFNVNGGLGFEEFISNRDAKFLKGNVTFRADCYISKEDSSLPQVNELFSRLDKLDRDLASDINAIPSNYHLLSDAFRQSLKHQAQSYHSKIDKAYTITSDVAANVLSILRKDFPKHIKKYINNIHAACYDTLTKAIKGAVNDEQHSELRDLFEIVGGKVLHQHLDAAKVHADFLLGLETEIHVHNENFKDAANAIRSHVFGTTSQTNTKKPSYLNDFTPAFINCMNEEDKTFLVMQLEIFDYWKLTKMRVVDNITMTAKSEMVTKAFGKTLRVYLLDEAGKFVNGADGKFSVIVAQNDAVKEKEQTKKVTQKVSEDDTETVNVSKRPRRVT